MSSRDDRSMRGTMTEGGRRGVTRTTYKSQDRDSYRRGPEVSRLKVTQGDRTTESLGVTLGHSVPV